MSFSWANNFAKNALKSAQKRIDSVLDIQEEEEEGETDAPNDTNPADAVAERLEEAEAKEEASASTSLQLHESIEIYTNPEVDSKGYVSNDLKYVDNGKTEWGSGWDSDDTHMVVDSEPNPIRDGHNQTGLIHHSPTSNSPDEEDADRSGGSPILDLSLVNIDQLECEAKASPIFQQCTQRNHDDATTIVSSDIEVLRHHDEWSMASSCQVKRNDHSSFIDASIENILENASVSQVDGTIVDQLAVFKAQFEHRGRRLEELTKQNEVLRSQNASLISKNKHLTSRTTEAKLQKQLAQKENELIELMDEGKRLAEHSGKQSKEIRRLKQEVNQLEIVTNARDSALEELQAAHANITELSAQIDELREKLKTTEAEHVKAKHESSLTQASSVLVQKHVKDQEAKVEELLEETGNLESQLREQTVVNQNLTRDIELLNRQLMTKKARDCIDTERVQCLQAELKEQQTMNSTLQRTVQELEKRIEQLLISKSEIATQIQQANVPLLENISSLEKELWEVKNFHSEELDSCNLKLKEVQSSCDSIKRKYETSSNRLNELSIEKEVLEKEYEIICDRLREKEKECDQFASETHELKMKLQALQRKESESVKALEEKYRQAVLENSSQAKTMCSLRTENEQLNTKMAELEIRLACEDKSQRSTPVSIDRIRPSSQKEFERTESVMTLSDINLPAPYSSSAALDELRHLTAVHEQTMARVGQLEAELDRTRHLQEAFNESEKRYHKLNMNYENLLEAHGERLEKIEELELDLSDMKQLLKEQMEEFLRQTNR
ncbi:hypothetical protein QR680_002166 [Steinernema hermaphroditum]|uniref:TATA element modulatory factor 1 TATA binding domain-containing protein n=1 Tax=Steinernema hermaphroditum TaxID=289476 RepID=A0AA39H1L0_9BILA|nr:hypothetical protein QR680_002166 [Steinernema hermaphroditum]